MKLGVNLEAITGRPPLADDLRDLPKALKEIFSAVVGAVKRYGIQAVELPMDAAAIYPSLFTRDVMLQAHCVAQESGFFFTIHLPHADIDLSSPDEEARQAGVERVLRAVAMAEPLEPQTYVLHLVGEKTGAGAGFYREVATQAIPQSHMDAAVCSLEEIVRKVDPQKLCVENLRGAPFYPQIPLAEAFGTSLCIDVGHFIVQGIEPLPFIREHWDKIKEIHLHDVTQELEDHHSLGTGLLDVEGILKTLKERDYQSILMVELFNREYLAPSMGVLDEILSRPSS